MCEKYCTDCIYLSDEQFVCIGRLYKNIIFRDDPTNIIHSGVKICVAKKEVSIGRSKNPITIDETIEIIVDNPYVLNSNNNCPHYKEPFFSRLGKFLYNIRLL